MRKYHVALRNGLNSWWERWSAVCRWIDGGIDCWFAGQDRWGL